jgi:hypothetical protein
MTGIERFQQQYPSDDSYWRSIILFGRNVASYKFALSKSLLEILPTSKTIISLDELAEPFSRYVCKHIANAPRQATSASSKFLDSCRKYNQGELSKASLLDTTVQLGFNNVLDAFHVVNEGNIPKTFFEKDFSGGHKNIILTDEIFRLQEIPFFDNLMSETESRWRLVETAWELGISRYLLGVQYDDEQQLLFVKQDIAKRKDVTSARDALNGYQKGKCFYCNADISLAEKEDGLCDVDHFYPHILQQYMRQINLNGVWNLVLACKECNRGANGKFARIPEPQYLEKLHSRNEYLITSHHPLRETIMAQTGGTEAKRIQFISNVDQAAIDKLIHRWGTALKGDSVI